jgi:hypothetical protein
MADPVGIITTILAVIGYIRAAADKVEQNREQCYRLATHAEAVLALIKEETENVPSADVLKRLGKIKR